MLLVSMIKYEIGRKVLNIDKSAVMQDVIFGGKGGKGEKDLYKPIITCNRYSERLIILCFWI